jgi:hypothetical protein
MKSRMLSVLGPLVLLSASCGAEVAYYAPGPPPPVRVEAFGPHPDRVTFGSVDIGAGAAAGTSGSAAGGNVRPVPDPCGWRRAGSVMADATGFTRVAGDSLSGGREDGSGPRTGSGATAAIAGLGFLFGRGRMNRGFHRTHNEVSIAPFKTRLALNGAVLRKIRGKAEQ